MVYAGHITKILTPPGEMEKAEWQTTRYHLTTTLMT